MTGIAFCLRDKTTGLCSDGGTFHPRMVSMDHAGLWRTVIGARRYIAYGSQMTTMKGFYDNFEIVEVEVKHVMTGKAPVSVK